MQESSIITGGSNDGYIRGNTNVFISGDADIWDIQGGSRRGSSVIGTYASGAEQPNLGTGSSKVIVCGDAVVRHTLAGSMTEGIDLSNKQAHPTVKNTNITVYDNALVGGIFGAGYDTFTASKVPSMYNGGSITIDMFGGTVGYIYGGGYRGDTGGNTKELPPIDSVNITITGGTVLGDVFGGGRGGLDRIFHSSAGERVPTSLSDGTDNLNYLDTTGSSKLFTDNLSITITGNVVIRGSVYGGGQSVPFLDMNSGTDKHTDGVASVECTNNITIYIYKGADGKCPSIGGSVYGSGMGINPVPGDKYGSVNTDYIYRDAGNNASFGSMPWISGLTNKYSVIDTTGKKPTGPLYYSEYAKVVAGGIHIKIEGCSGGAGASSVSNQAIFGGGAFGKTNVGVITIDITGSDVDRSVFGGGRGSDDDNFADYGMLSGINSDANNITPISSININIDRSRIGTEGTKVALTGGGTYAFTSAEKVNIWLKNGSTVYGAVHGGGVGKSVAKGQMSASASMEASRNIIIDGAKVYGDVFGGSRMGSDKPFSGKPDTSMLPTASIYVVNGEITQGLYGGGFQGESYLNTYLDIGADAALLYGSSSSNTVSLNSVYGGSNLLGGDAGKVLLHGDTRIQIKENGIKETITGTKNYYSDISIGGVLFGKGNFSTISGESSLEMEGFDNTLDGALLTVQFMDRMTIEDSDVYIAGGSRGFSTDMSTMVSIADVGNLTLKGGVTLHLYAETSSISEFNSYIGPELAVKESCQDSKDRNHIVLNKGKMLIVLGPGDSGLTVDQKGVIHGYTLLSRPDSVDYYGAYAQASAETGVDGGFMVKDGSIEAAEMTDADNVVKTWYVSGHVDKDLSVTMKASNNTVSYVNDIKLFKIGGRSTNISFTGVFLNPVVKESIHLVSKVPDRYNPGSNLMMKVTLGMAGGKYLSFDGGSVDVVTHTYDEKSTEENKWVRVQQKVSGNENDLLHLEMSLLQPNIPEYQTPGSYTNYMSGNVGGMVLNFTESKSVMSTVDNPDGTVTKRTTDVPVNMVDLSISMFIQPPVNTENEVTMVTSCVVTKGSGNRGHATAYIIFPDLGGKHTYYLSSCGGTGWNADLYADNRYHGTTGWVTSDHFKVPFSTSGSFGQDLHELGVAGVKPATLRVELDVDSGVKSFDMHVKAYDMQHSPGDSGYKPYTYNITVNLEAPGTVNLYCIYKPTDSSGYRYVSVSGEGTEASPYELAWSVYNGDSSDEGNSPFKLRFGAVPETETVWILESDGKGGKDKVQKTLEQVINDMVSSISSNDFDYGRNFLGLFMSEDRVRIFNTSSPITEDQQMYACFGIKVKFRGDGISLLMSEVVLTPNASLHDYGILNYNESSIEGVDNPIRICGSEMRPGYNLDGLNRFTDPDETFDRLRWYDEATGRPYDFDKKITESADLYLDWQPNLYKVTIDLGNPDINIKPSSPNAAAGTFVKVDRYIGEQTSLVLTKHTGKIDLGGGASAVLKNAFDIYVYYDGSYAVDLTTNYRLDSVLDTKGHDYTKDYRIQGVGMREVKFRVPVLDGVTSTEEVPFYDAGGNEVKESMTVRGTGYIPLNAIMAWTLTIELAGKNAAMMSDDLRAGVSVTIDGRPLDFGNKLHFVTSVAVPKENPEAIGTKELKLSSNDSHHAFAFWVEENGVLKTYNSDFARHQLPIDGLSPYPYGVSTKSDLVLKLAIYRMSDLNVSYEDANTMKFANPKNIGDTPNPGTYYVIGHTLDVNSADNGFLWKYGDPVYNGYEIRVGKETEYNSPLMPPGAQRDAVENAFAYYSVSDNANGVSVVLFRPNILYMQIDFGNITSAQLRGYNQYYNVTAADGSVSEKRYVLTITVMDQKMDTSVSEIAQLTIEELADLMDNAYVPPSTDEGKGMNVCPADTAGDGKIVVRLELPRLKQFMTEFDLPGFTAETQDSSHYRLVLDSYKIVYRSQDGKQVQEREWNVLGERSMNHPSAVGSPEFNPYMVNGQEVWINTDGKGLGFLSGDVKHEQFANKVGADGRSQLTLVLDEFPLVMGQVQEVDKKTVYIYENWWGNTLKVSGLFKNQCSLTNHNSETVTYDPVSGELVLPKAGATGSIIFVDTANNYVLEVVSISGIYPIPPKHITLDSSGTAVYQTIQGSQGN